MKGASIIKKIDNKAHSFALLLHKKNKLHYFFSILYLTIFAFPMSLITARYGTYLLVMILLVSILNIVFLARKFIKKRLMKILLIMGGLFFLSIIVNGVGYLTGLAFGVYVSGFINGILYLYYIDKTNFIKALADYSFVMIMVNGILSLLFQNGLYQVPNAIGQGMDVYFLGVGNQLNMYTITYFVILILVYKFNREDPIKLFISGVMTLISAYFADSATGYIGIIFLSLLLACYYIVRWLMPYRSFRVKRKILWSLALIVLVLGINYALTVLNLQRFFGSVLERVFDKDTTFSSRTNIWKEAFRLFKESPIFGRGFPSLNSHIFMKKAGYWFGAHNLIIEVGIISGIPGLIVFTYLLYYEFRRIFETRLFDIMFIVLTLFLTFLLMSVSEVYYIPIVVLIILLIEIFEDYSRFMNNKVRNDRVLMANDLVER